MHMIQDQWEEGGDGFIGGHVDVRDTLARATNQSSFRYQDDVMADIGK